MLHVAGNILLTTAVLNKRSNLRENWYILEDDMPDDIWVSRLIALKFPKSNCDLLFVQNNAIL